MPLLTEFLQPATVLAAVGSGLMAGLLFAFSNFVMRALTRLPGEQGMAAMQLINLTIINPGFLGLFLGTGLLCALLALHSLSPWKSAASNWLLVGSACYVLGPLGVTLAFNVPLNNALVSTSLSARSAAEAWPAYVAAWLRWNHVRTLLAVGAALSLTLATLRMHGAPP